MPWVGTPEASQKPRPRGCRAAAFPVGRAGRLLRSGSISGLFIPFTGVPAYDLPVYASPGPLPYPTQDSVPDCGLGFVRVAISDDWTFCACKAQLPHHRAYGSRTTAVRWRCSRDVQPRHSPTIDMAARPSKGQRRTPAQAPGTMGGLGRVPRPVAPDPTCPPLLVPAPPHGFHREPRRRR